MSARVVWRTCLVDLVAVSERNRDSESSCVKYYSAAIVCCIAHVLFVFEMLL